MTVDQQIASQAWNVVSSVDFQSSILSGVLLAIVAAAFRFLRSKPRVVWANNHQFAFYLPPIPAGDQGVDGLQVFTRTIYVANEGSAPAKTVEVHFTGRPKHFQIWPTIERQDVTLADGAFIVRIPLLAPSESCSLEILQTADPMPNVIRVRSESGAAQEIAVVPTRILSPQRQAILIGLILLGAWTVLRWLTAFVINALS
jgi:hypothetical protein